MPKPPELELDFGTAIPGYWNGGPKQRGTFTPNVAMVMAYKIMPADAEGRRKVVVGPPNVHPGPGYWIKWGSFELNFWFRARSGRTWREAASVARRRLLYLVGRDGATVTVMGA